MVKNESAAVPKFHIGDEVYCKIHDYSGWKWIVGKVESISLQGGYWDYGLKIGENRDKHTRSEFSEWELEEAQKEMKELFKVQKKKEAEIKKEGCGHFLVSIDNRAIKKYGIRHEICNRCWKVWKNPAVATPNKPGVKSEAEDGTKKLLTKKELTEYLKDPREDCIKGLRKHYKKSKK